MNSDKAGLSLKRWYKARYSLHSLDSVGLYVPGGKAAYPSSVLMNAMPAHVAGVKNIVMVVPTPGGTPNQSRARRRLL